MAVKQTFTGDATALEAEYAKLERRAARLEQQNAQLSQKSRQQNDDARRGFDAQSQAIGGAITKVAGLIGGMVSLNSIIRTVQQSFERQDQMAQRSLDSASRLAQSQQGALINLQATDPESREFFQRIAEVNRAARFANEPALTIAASDLVSATGSRELALNVVQKLAPLLRQDPSQLPETAGAVGDIATLIDDVTGERAIGLVLATQAQSRATSLTAFKELARGAAVAAVSDTGDSRERAVTDALALEAALTRSLKDPDARISKTATAALAAQLAAFLPEQDLVGPGGEVIRGGTGLETLPQRIQALQQDVELFRQFRFGDAEAGVSPAAFERQSAELLFQLLGDSSSEIAQNFERTLRTLAPDLERLQRLEQQASGVTPQLRFATRQKEIESIVEPFTSGDLQRLELAIANQAIESAREIAVDNTFDVVSARLRDIGLIANRLAGTAPLERAELEIGTMLVGLKGRADQRVIELFDEEGRARNEQQQELLRDILGVLKSIDTKNAASLQAAQARLGAAAPQQVGAGGE